jgi:hypothetical protein
MKKLIAPLSLALGALGVLFAGLLVSANASTAVDPDNTNLLELAKPIFDEVMKGHYVAAAAAALILSMALIRRYAPGKAGEFVHSDLGGSLSTLLMSMFGAIFTATVGGAAWHWNMLWMAFIVGITAMGGYTAIKRLIVVPLLLPLQSKLPVWAQPALNLVLWIFDRKFGADPVKDAEAAGNAAVAKNPPTGADGVAPPTDL